MEHNAIKHLQRKYVGDDIHANTIEGYGFSLGTVRRAWYEQHRNYRKGFSPSYVAEACYKYNNSTIRNPFGAFLLGSFR